MHKDIDALDKGKSAPNFSNLDAMVVHTGALDRVTTETVRNCFKTAEIGSEAQENAVHDTDDPFKFLAEELVSLRESCPELVSECVNPDDVIETDQGWLTSTSLITDEDILAEFKTDDSIEQEHSDDEIEMLENNPKKSTLNEVRQSIDILTTYSFFVSEGAEEICQLAGKLSALTEWNMSQSQQKRSIKYYSEEMQMVDIRTESQPQKFVVNFLVFSKARVFVSIR